MSAVFLAAPFLQISVDPNQFNGYLILGYIIMWLIAVIYIASLFVRQRNLQQDLKLMEQIIEEEDETPRT